MGYKVAVLTDTHAPEATAGCAESACPDVQWICDALAQAGHEAVTLHAGAHLTHDLREARPDVAIVAHGQTGRAAQAGVESLLELLGIPHVGAPALTCREVADRALLAQRIERLRGEGEPLAAATPCGVALTPGAIASLGALDAIDLIEGAVPAGYPVCVRGCLPGLMPGVSKADDRASLATVLAQASQSAGAASGCPVIVQEWVQGVEMVVPVLGDERDAYVLPPVEAPAPGGAPVCPVRGESLSPSGQEAQAIRSEIERAALDAYLASGCRDLGCVTLMWDGGRCHVLGVDPTPDMSAHGLVRLSIKAAGISPSEILDELVSVAVERGN